MPATRMPLVDSGGAARLLGSDVDEPHLLVEEQVVGVGRHGPSLGGSGATAPRASQPVD